MIVYDGQLMLFSERLASVVKVMQTLFYYYYVEKIKYQKVSFTKSIWKNGQTCTLAHSWFSPTMINPEKSKGKWPILGLSRAQSVIMPTLDVILTSVQK